MRKFTDHPHSVGETYIQHMGIAFSFAGNMLLGSIACCVHGIFPFLCTTRGSKTIQDLNNRMITHRHLECQQKSDFTRAE